MSSVEVRVDVERIRRQLERDIQNVRDAETGVLDDGSALALQFVKEEAPLGQTAFGKISGRLKDAFDVEKKAHERVIKPDLALAPHAPYVISGTGRRPGRFVPAIGKRLVRPSTWNPYIGTHPGTPANPFIERAYQRVMGVIDNLIRRVTDRMRL